MRSAFAAAFLALGACAVAGAEPASIDSATISAAKSAAYAPMAAFAPFSGKTFRGEWRDEKGELFVDIAKYELILNGRALQSTHRLEGRDYGGRTIFFYDEGAKAYVFHYFTTAGFHTTGTSQFVDGGLVTEEAVEGHASVASVRSTVAFGKDQILIDVVYVGKDGSQSPSARRVYKPIADQGPLFPDTR